MRRHKPKQIKLQSLAHGGIRQGAGRPKTSTRISHDSRPKVDGKFPMHITVSLREGARNLRTKDSYCTFRNAVKRAALKGLRIIHYALLGDHLHVLAEANSNYELACGMKSLNNSLAKAFGEGALVGDRYHLQLLKSPTQMKNALRYVFANAAKHFGLTRAFDWFSSYIAFDYEIEFDRLYDWSKPHSPSERGYKLIKSVLSPPTTWLATVGWKLAL